MKNDPAHLSPEACRAARALLSWGVRDLAREAGVSVDTVSALENGRPMRDGTRAALAAAFDVAGVELLNGGAPGARLRRSQQ